MAFIQPNPGDIVSAEHINQFAKALNGTTGAAQPIKLTALNSSDWALQIRNLDPTNSRALQVLGHDGTVLLQVDGNGVSAVFSQSQRTQRVFIPCVALKRPEWTATGDAPPIIDYLRFDENGVLTHINYTSTAYTTFLVPEDFKENLVVKSVVYNSDARGYPPGQICVSNRIVCYTIDEGFTEATITETGTVVASIPSDMITVVTTQTVEDAAKGDILDLTWKRLGGDPQDTFQLFCYFKGWLIEYTAEQ